MKLQKFASLSLVAIGALFSISVVTAQPVMSGIYPNGTNLFQPSATLSFTASSAFTITNVQVQLIGTPLTGGAQVLQLLSPANGLNVVGFPSATITASCPLQANLTYSATIAATDNSGSTSSTNVSFNTVSPVYTWEAEDWDYTNGMYIDNPQTNAYAGLSGVSGVDFFDDGTGQASNYRPSGPNGLGNENCGDTPRLTHLGFQDYDVGWNNGGYWGSYTRQYPAGTYYVFMRGSSTTANQRNADLTVVSGTAALNGASGTFAFRVPNTGNNQIYGFGPLLDANGNYVTFTSDGSASTLRVTVDQGGYNANFYMLMPTNINNAPAGSITFSNFYPDGQFQFEQTNQFVFTASSPVGIDPNSMILQVSATTLAGSNSVQLVSPVNGLAVGGSGTSLNASMMLATDMVYHIFIQVTDSNGVPASTNITFDTVNPNYYTWEAEDYNYQNGQFIDNPQTNAYYDYALSGAYNAVSGIDAVYTGGGGHSNFRTGLSTEGAGDLKRSQFTVVDPRTGANYIDFDCGSSSGGSWGDYTRTFPAGIYNIYVRGANGGGANSDSGSFGVVTGDAGTASQTNNILGKFAAPATGGWQTYAWVPVKLTTGSLVQLHATGSPMTLRETTDGGSLNLNYYMLVPADTSLTLPPYISNFTPDGASFFQEAPQLSFVANSQAGVSAGNITLNLNGINVTGFVTSGTPNALNVSYPVLTNKFYTAIVTVTDNYGTSITTNQFDTFDLDASYVFQAEDYDYGGGQFFDNSYPGQYSGYQGVLNVDDYWDYNQGAGYRPSAEAGEGLATEHPSGDVLLPSFNGDNTYDYDIGHNDPANWANYTRTYPAGIYNIYMRSATGVGQSTANATKVSVVTSGWGTTSQTLTDLGTFTSPNTAGWHTFTWTPLVDANGNLVQWDSSGSTNTLRVTVVNGGYNVNFYALVPADTNAPVLSSIYPNGAYQFQNSGTLSFTASAANGLDGSGISVQLTGTNLLGQTFTTNITTANGLNVGGSSTSLNASLNLDANTTYTAVITVTALNGEQTISTVHFDTIVPSMTFEAEDWNYTDTNSGIAGLFIDTPQTNAYAGLAATAGVDYTNVNTAQGGPNYRPFGLATEDCSDVKRASYATLQDYDVGNNNGGNWANYTRTFPSGVYNIYMRAANGDSSSHSDAASMSLVTSAATNASQTTLKLGTFNMPSTGGWQAYVDVPLIDQDGNYAEFVGGSQETLRATIDNGYCNQNYYFLVPAETVLPVNPPNLKAAQNGTNIVVSFLSRTNTAYVLESKTNLTDPAWTPVLTNNGTASWISITNAVGGGSGFYHLKLQ